MRALRVIFMIPCGRAGYDGMLELLLSGIPMSALIVNCYKQLVEEQEVLQIIGNNIPENAWRVE